MFWKGEPQFGSWWWCLPCSRGVVCVVCGQGNEMAFLAAYLDASNALREDPDLEKQVCFPPYLAALRGVRDARSRPVEVWRRGKGLKKPDRDRFTFPVERRLEQPIKPAANHGQNSGQTA